MNVLVDRAEAIVPLLVKYLTRTAAIPLTLNHNVPIEHRLDAAARGYDVEAALCVSGTWDLTAVPAALPLPPRPPLSTTFEAL